MGFEVVVSAPSSVGAGVVEARWGSGRLRGSLGLALLEPRLVVRASPCEGVEAEGPRGAEAARFAEAACRLARCRGLRVTVEGSIPEGVGLGSTAALALAVGLAASIISGSRLDLGEYAVEVGCCMDSGVALHAFTHGGFVVDGGRPAGGGAREAPPLIYRSPVPPRVAVVAALPEALRGGAPGPGAGEPAGGAGLVLLGLLPALARGRFEEAAGILQGLNEGRYCCGEVEGLARAMLGAGGWCACQSRGGPLVYSLTDYRAAGRVAAAARRYLAGIGGGRVWVTRVDNRGASYTLSPLGAGSGGEGSRSRPGDSHDGHPGPGR
ncbi:GHMP family kinase ATP-binding protein [Stetteria hydrogenophila]